MTGALRGRAARLAAVALFALAGALAAYAAWSYAEVQRIIRAAVEAGQLAGEGTEYDIASFTMSSSGQYLVLAVVLAVLAWLVLRTGPRAAEVGESAESDERLGELDDDDLEDGDVDDLDALDENLSLDEFVNPGRPRDHPA